MASRWRWSWRRLRHPRPCCCCCWCTAIQGSLCSHNTVGNETRHIHMHGLLLLLVLVLAMRGGFSQVKHVGLLLQGTWLCHSRHVDVEGKAGESEGRGRRGRMAEEEEETYLGRNADVEVSVGGVGGSPVRWLAWCRWQQLHWEPKQIAS